MDYNKMSITDTELLGGNKQKLEKNTVKPE